MGISWSSLSLVLTVRCREDFVLVSGSCQFTFFPSNLLPVWSHPLPLRLFNATYESPFHICLLSSDPCIQPPTCHHHLGISLASQTRLSYNEFISCLLNFPSSLVFTQTMTASLPRWSWGNQGGVLTDSASPFPPPPHPNPRHSWTVIKSCQPNSLPKSSHVCPLLCISLPAPCPCTRHQSLLPGQSLVHSYNRLIYFPGSNKKDFLKKHKSNYVTFLLKHNQWCSISFIKKCKSVATAHSALPNLAIPSSSMSPFSVHAVLLPHRHTPIPLDLPCCHFFPLWLSHFLYIY